MKHAMWHRAGARRTALIVWLAGALAGAGGAGAIVSERHLRGVKALACELEAAGDGAAPVRFRLAVNGKERTLRLESDGAPFRYQEVSDSTLRFPLSLPAANELTCELELPAGALSCAAGAATPRLGLCLPAP